MKLTKILGFLSTICIVFLAEPTLAQSPWHAGVKVGANSARLRGNQVSLFVNGAGLDVAGAVGEYRHGFVGGGFVNRTISEHVALQAELLYSQKGGEGDVFGTVDIEYPGNVIRTGTVNGRLSLRLDYVEIPVVALFRFPADDKLRVDVLAGGAFAFRTAARAKIEGVASVTLPNQNPQTISFDQDTSIGGDVKTWEISGIIGMALDYKMKKANLIVDGRLTFGLTTIDETGSTDVWNQALSLNAGLAIPFGS